jgi:phosphopantothenate---cysteine ligase (CTP)
MAYCIVTCGPSSTPIDEVRRITNFSTGELGVNLTQNLLSAGHEVICLRGYGSTYPLAGGIFSRSFTTNHELMILLKKAAHKNKIDFVFHAAALTDFEIVNVSDLNGVTLSSEKLSSSLPGINIQLRPAAKVITELRAMFPSSYIVGWKYELTGTFEESLHKGLRQMESYQTDACIVNGRAVGSGFVYLTKDGRQHFLDKPSLIKSLVKLASE